MKWLIVVGRGGEGKYKIKQVKYSFEQNLYYPVATNGISGFGNDE